MTHAEIEQQDIIDRYLLRRLSPVEESDFEDHFLGCPECGEKLESSQDAIAAIRHACAAASRTPEAHPRKRPVWLSSPAWGLAAAVGLAAVYVSLAPTPRQEASSNRVEGDRGGQVVPGASSLPTIELRSYRGGAGEISRLKAAAAERPFLLRLDVRGLDAHEKYTIDIVDSSGRAVWSGGAMTAGEESVRAKVDTARFPPGTFWVRLSGVAPDSGSMLLREYALLVDP